ncbi:unnamed protein product [Effrenium voratum]|uniref:D-lactate dehydrogenase n=1 Tax=Effrenium voratum TaxID=2562239 RepID=A0AA36IYX4_9DINO|nr:unnamed protein product [Effrenium voratum]
MRAAEALATIAETTLKSLAGVRDGAGPPKQNGTLDTVCRPAASSSKTPQVERMERMELMAALPDPAPPLKAADFPPLENTGAPFKVAVFSAREHDIEEFQQANEDFGGNFTFCFHSAQLCLDTVDLVRGADAVCIFVHDDCSAPVLQLLREGGVKMVALRCAGFNNVDLEAAARLGVAVARVPAYSTCAVAEHAAALVASVVRCIPQAVENTRRCNFALNGLLGFDMIGKTVGIIGTGLTGSISARIFKQGYGCEVIANDVVENPKVKDAAPDGLGIAYVSQEEIFSRSDIILLHAPLLRETHKIINAEAIQKMKRGVIIVNTSRGGLIDTKALIQGLQEGIVGGAGLDVLAEEEEYFFHNWSNKVLLNDELSVLSCFNNVVITAHQAFFTREALLSICHTTLSNLNAARNGLEPPMQRGKYPTLLTK